MAGYQQQTGHRLDDTQALEILAMNHFYSWIRVCRWGWWDGDPAHVDHAAASEENAESIYRQLRRDSELMAKYHPAIAEWLI